MKGDALAREWSGHVSKIRQINDVPTEAWYVTVCIAGPRPDIHECNAVTLVHGRGSEGAALTQEASPRPDAPLNVLGREIIEINRANGWNVCRPNDWVRGGTGIQSVYKLGTVLALIHSEVSEALEALRKNDRENFEEELADVLIRVLDCSAGLGIDMDANVRAKLEKNRQRAHRHGGKAV